MELKHYQEGVLLKLEEYLTVLDDTQTQAELFVQFQKQQGREAIIGNYCADTWGVLNQNRSLPYLQDKQGNKIVSPYLSRYDGLDRSIPNVCYRVPTGGGKTLLAAASLERIQTDYFKQQTGLVLWVVPSDSIYRQTWKQLANREHPYRQMLERASGGRVKLLEKNDSFTKQDVDQQLCVMMLMLQSSARKSKDTLRMFRDSGRFTSFFPIEDDVSKNEELLNQVKNLDTNDLFEEGLFGSSTSIKMSLGNVLRLARPTIVIDEGHKAYSDTARETLCGFNPKFILELSATPNSKGKHQSNVLVNVPGKDLKDEQMIKLPINVINEDGADWKHTLTVAHTKLNSLQNDSNLLLNEQGRYIRPIMLIRVERTGKDQRDSSFVHTEDVREYLIQNLGVTEDSIREKTANADELGDEDLLSDLSPVRYIITKDALKEGWDCPFAYVLTILSKMTAQTALTQMIGRVLRQPDAKITGIQSLDECYVYTFDQDVNDAVDGVRKGLEEEGLGDLAGFVHGANDNGESKVESKVEKIKIRPRFNNGQKILLPKIFHRDVAATEGYRNFDYERDILGILEWDEFDYDNVANFHLIEDRLHRTIARISYKKNGEEDQLGLELTQEELEDIAGEWLDEPFLVRQLMEVIPNPWQCMRILESTLSGLRAAGVSEEQLYVGRLELLKDMKKNLRAQLMERSEKVFLEKLKIGELSLRLVAPLESDLNWELAQEVDVQVYEDDRLLKRKNGEPLERSLYEKVYERGVNNLEKQTALYLDGKETVYWWHRIAVNQRDYSIQGWQKNKVYPDLLVCLEKETKGKLSFSLLETKGDHLKGNNDTEYKKRLFNLLTEHIENAISVGELELEMAAGGMSFKMLLEDDWKQEIQEFGI
ncbi:DEAD/DEAH box helicase family protein [Thalassotalea psychrophila]|uniref:DEAD/DEAH box helicase family protein n=1 Tax=Thalassotalea psychrophila TaxID=3065647 RepID=A0ABY9TV58_9GAMM|nr:DEAD/DEAH box helicase family protein [Colwelliaceae bacterium SQ149]